MRYFYNLTTLVLLCVINSRVLASVDSGIESEGREILSSIERIESLEMPTERSLPTPPQRKFIAETNNSLTASWKLLLPEERVKSWNSDVLKQRIEEQEKDREILYELEIFMSQEYLDNQTRLAEEEEQSNQRLYSREYRKRLRSPI